VAALLIIKSKIKQHFSLGFGISRGKKIVFLNTAKKLQRLQTMQQLNAMFDLCGGLLINV
jgi:hypothetical protein